MDRSARLVLSRLHGTTTPARFLLRCFSFSHISDCQTTCCRGSAVFFSDRRLPRSWSFRLKQKRSRGRLPAFCKDAARGFRLLVNCDGGRPAGSFGAASGCQGLRLSVCVFEGRTRGCFRIDSVRYSQEVLAGGLLEAGLKHPRAAIGAPALQNQRSDVALQLELNPACA